MTVLDHHTLIHTHNAAISTSAVTTAIDIATAAFLFVIVIWPACPTLAQNAPYHTTVA